MLAPGAELHEDVGQWVRATCFKEVASAIAAARKGDRVYCEGSLTMTQWNDAHGEARHGLSVSAWKVVLLDQIGERRKQTRKPPDPNGPKPAGKDVGRDFNDPLPFLMGSAAVFLIFADFCRARSCAATAKVKKSGF